MVNRPARRVNRCWKFEKTGITNTLIVVTRYFGGIKLGAGGLIRAYSHSAAEVIHDAPKTLYAPRQIVALTIDYSYYGAIERFLQEQGYHYESEFAEQVRLLIYVDPADINTLATTMTNLTNGQQTWEPLEEKMVALPYND